MSAWEFWVRLEIVGWDCIEVGHLRDRFIQLLISIMFQDIRSLDSFKWYKGLYEYSRPIKEDTEEDEERELGPDGDLVASMVSTAIIPRVCKVVEGGALDVYSEGHIKRMVDLAEEIEATMDEGNSKFQVCEILPIDSFIIKY